MVANSKLKSVKITPCVWVGKMVSSLAVVKEFYERIQVNGKCKKQAICACMRKLVHICFGVIKHQKPFQSQVASLA